MKFFLDTADIAEIEHWQRYGLVEGVTTNPTLLSKQSADPLDQVARIAGLVDGPVSAQVAFTDHKRMISQGKRLSKIASNVVVKVPATLDGVLAATALASEGIPCNITLTFDFAQAIPFARIPAAFISVILGRPDDFGIDNMDSVRRLRVMLDNIGSATKLLAASIRTPGQLFAAFEGGADVVTVPPSTWVNAFVNPQTLDGERSFLSAWATIDEKRRSRYESLQ